jgi:isopentenyl-diphosphate delta-isomerase
MDRCKVVLVDEHDNPTGQMDKLEAHEKGLLHRAFSVFIFNSRGEILIQQRAANKYHGAHLWTNACCSHPQWGEEVIASAQERLFYEMGINCALEHAFSFIYNSPVENNLIEHEYDHVLIGYTDVGPAPNPSEVQHFYWMKIQPLKEIMLHYPEKFTAWFKIAYDRVINHIGHLQE